MAWTNPQSFNWQPVDFARLKLPNYMRIDWVRVYQRSDRISVGCDPEGRSMLSGQRLIHRLPNQRLHREAH
jgi:hypothetical protein